MTNPELALVGDIGATNSRFALVLPDGTMTRARVVASVDFTDIGTPSSITWRAKRHQTGRRAACLQ
jgi:glucokinase